MSNVLTKALFLYTVHRERAAVAGMLELVSYSIGKDVGILQ